MRTGIASALLALAAWAAAPGSAHADGPHGQMAFLASMTIELTVDRLTLEDQFLIRLPHGEADDGKGEPKLPLGGTQGVVDLLGAGLDVTSPEEDEGAIVLQLRPNFGRRGGVLRCTFRF